MPTTTSQITNDYSTSGKQDTGNTSLASIDTKVATAANQTTEIASLASIDTKVTGVSTAAKQDTGNASLASIDTKLSSQATAANQTTGNASLSSIDTKLSSQATAANQASEITKLTSIDGKLNSLGQKTMANSMPVAIASDQSTVPVSAASLPLPSGASTAANQATEIASLSSIDTKLSSQATAANQASEITKLTSIDGKLNSLGQKTMSGSMPVTVASDQPAIPVSAASLPLPSGASTAVNQATEIASLASIDTKLSGQATAANQVTELASLASIDAGIPASLGQKTMANSMAVVVASDQSALPVTGTFFQATQPVSVASLPLPAGASTAANQATTNASLASIDAGIPAALGSTTGANSMPVVIASDQVLPLPTGAATAANQSLEIAKLTTIDTSLSSIDAGIPVSLGQKTMANSMPIVFPSDQTLPVSASTLDGNKNTYSASISGLVTAASATDIFTLSGSATKTVRVLAVWISGTTSAGSGISVSTTLIKRSSVDTSGTSTSPAVVPYDSSDSAATASVKAYTVNPTLGSAIGNIMAQRISLPTSGAGGFGSAGAYYEYGSRPGRAIVLRGANEQLCVNFGATTVTGSLISITIEWTEE